MQTMHGLNMYDQGARFFGATLPIPLQPDPLAEKYPNMSPYLQYAGNAVKYIDADGRSFLDFVVGVIHSVGSNLALGTVPTNTSGVANASHYNAGRDVGDAVGIVMGAAEAVVGAVAAGGGTVATVGTAGVGSPVTVPVAAAGAAMTAHGAAVTGTAAKSMANQEGRMSQSSSSKSSSSSGNTDKGTLSGTKSAVKEAQEKVGGSLPKGEPGKQGSPQRGDSKKGYRLDPGHPNRPAGDAESGPHVNWWDYTKGKRGAGGESGAIPIK